MDIGVIAFILLLIFGIIMKAAPQSLIKEDRRDDPSAIEQVRKCGSAILGFAAFAGFLMLKYSIL